MNQPIFRLVMRKGPTPGQVYDLVKTETVIGRDIVNDIVINDSEVSRRHVRLTFEAGRFMIQDDGSTNGTFVNGQRLMGPHVLGVGETIMLGENVHLVFEAAYSDPNATVMSAGAAAAPAPLPGYQQPPAYHPPEPQPPAYRPPEPQPPAYQPPPSGYAQPAYVNQVTEGPDELPPPPAPAKKSPNTWLLAGCGCLVLLVVLVVIAAIVIDVLQLWCPLFGFLIPACQG